MTGTRDLEGGEAVISAVHGELEIYRGVNTSSLSVPFFSSFSFYTYFFMRILFPPLLCFSSCSLFYTAVLHSPPTPLR